MKNTISIIVECFSFFRHFLLHFMFSCFVVVVFAFKSISIVKSVRINAYINMYVYMFACQPPNIQVALINEENFRKMQKLSAVKTKMQSIVQKQSSCQQKQNTLRRNISTHVYMYVCMYISCFYKRKNFGKCW